MRLMRPNQHASFCSFYGFYWSHSLFVFAKGHNSMLSSPDPHRCCDRSNTYKCLLCEIGGLDSKAFKEILYMILHNREQMSLRHHSACFSKVISTKIKKIKNKKFQNNVICVFAVFKKEKSQICLGCQHPEDKRVTKFQWGVSAFSKAASRCATSIFRGLQAVFYSLSGPFFTLSSSMSSTGHSQLHCSHCPLIHSVLPSLPDLHILVDIRQHSTIHSQAQLDRVRF